MLFENVSTPCEVYLETALITCDRRQKESQLKSKLEVSLRICQRVKFLDPRLKGHLKVADSKVKLSRGFVALWEPIDAIFFP